MGNMDDDNGSTSISGKQNGANEYDVKLGWAKLVLNYLFNTSPWKILFHTLLFGLLSFIILFIYDVYRYVDKGNTLASYVQTSLETSQDHYLQYTKLSGVSEDLLEEIRIELGAVDVSIFLLHNGKASLGGIPFLKVSQFATSKIIVPGLVRIIDEPINNFPNLQSTLQGNIVDHKISDMPLGSVYRSNQPKDFVDYRLYRGPLFRTFEGVPHGWLMITFERELNEVEYNKIVNALNKYSSLFQAIFSIVPKPK